MTLTLPQDFRVRHPTLEDVGIVVGLFTICQQAEFGVAEITEADALAIWQTPEVDVARDIWLIFSQDDQLVAYLQLGHEKPLRMQIIMKVHPDYDNLGLQAFLLERAEERARTLIPDLRADARVTLQTSCSRSNQVYRQFIEQAGFVHVRSDWRMEIVMDEPPPAPVWPDGIALHPFTLDMARAVYAADQEGFNDHWGFTPMDFETFEYWFISTPGFDPTLWFLPFEGEQIAGAAFCECREDIAWVNSLSVLRPWRRKGLGLALLHHAFGEFYRRGYHRADLYVDSQNLTGATRLYERAGMHIVRQFDKYEKELRPGIELSVQSLAD
ncbi:MAG TPA: GNAT family N-acetyltransferase [Ktedonobacteraceae bacterium]|nr:GNAT family N-acetyltransferase [Ktedonobacteraceae bacterium]